MVPGKYNILCPQGSTFNLTMNYFVDDAPVDLTTYTAKMQVRESHSSENVVTELSTDNDLITLSDLGVITLTIPDETTANFVPKEYVYDIELMVSGTVSRIIEGKFVVTPEVTR